MRKTRLIAALCGCVAAVSAAWLLFGFDTSSMAGAAVRKQRFFGRVVTIEVDTPRTSSVEEVWQFSWRNPAVHHTLPQALFADRNGDGYKETVIRPLNPNDLRTTAKFEVDTDRDGVPNHVFIESFASGAGGQRVDALLRAVASTRT